MPECEQCHTTENITEHHPNGHHKGPKIYLCRDHHDEEDGMNKRKETLNSFKRLIRRALRRLERDIKIIEDAEEKLNYVEMGE